MLRKETFDDPLLHIYCKLEEIFEESTVELPKKSIFCPYNKTRLHSTISEIIQEGFDRVDPIHAIVDSRISYKDVLPV